MRIAGKIQRMIRSSLVLLFALFFHSLQLHAQGNLLINPKRVVFDGGSRSQEINLINIGKDSARYAVSFVQYRMTSDGRLELIDKPDPGQLFADKNLRIFPRTVVLAPNEAQVVKVQVTQTDKLQPGEYRSHLYFRALAEERPLGLKEDTPDSKDLSVQLKAVFGISIPVIIRKGTSTAKASISEVHIANTGTGPVASFRINRSGNMSVYGDITVEHISAGGKVTVAGLAKGVSVYAPMPYREMQLVLGSGIDYRTGKLRVVYTAPALENKAQLAVAEAILK